MRVPHKAVVLVADGRKMLLLRNEGDGELLNLQVEQCEVQENPKDSDQKTDAAGRSSYMQSDPGASSVAQNGSMRARGSMGETDYHQMEEDKFATEIAELLKKQAMSGSYESLIIVAPPKTLGELRKHYHKEVTDRLVGELDKDLTGHPIPEIENALVTA